MNFKNVIMLSLGMTLFFVVTSMIKRKFTDKTPQEMALHEEKDNRPRSKNTKASGRTP